MPRDNMPRVNMPRDNMPRDIMPPRQYAPRQYAPRQYATWRQPATWKQSATRDLPPENLPQGTKCQHTIYVSRETCTRDSMPPEYLQFQQTQYATETWTTRGNMALYSYYDYNCVPYKLATFCCFICGKFCSSDHLFMYS